MWLMMRNGRVVYDDDLCKIKKFIGIVYMKQYSK